MREQNIFDVIKDPALRALISKAEIKTTTNIPENREKDKQKKRSQSKPKERRRYNDDKYTNTQQQQSQKFVPPVIK